MATKEIRLPFTVKSPILACGADMKGSFAIARGKAVRLFDGFGDLADLDNFVRYEKSIVREVRKAHPEAAVCDLHPGYLSTGFAERLASGGLKLIRVQHHEAHIASAIVDHALKGDVIGVAFDGTGYGSDGNMWGGEFFTGGLKKLKRVAHLAYIPMPGGGSAISQPWRMAAAYLYSAFGAGAADLRIDCVRYMAGKKWRIVTGMIDKEVNAPLTSSAGRLFDAAGSIILSKYAVKGEAELPMELERIASREWADSYDFELRKDAGMILIDAKKTIRGIAADIANDTDRSIVSGRFHNTVAWMMVKTCLILRKICKLDRIVLSGGVFQNELLSGRVTHLLSEEGFDVYRHSRVDTNDAGIPIGQIALAKRALCA